MPADDGVRLHEDEGGPPPRPRTGQQYPEHPIAGAETRVRGTLQHPQLLPQRYVLEHNVVVSAARHHDRAYDQQDQCDHGQILVSVVRPNQRRIEFWRTTHIQDPKGRPGRATRYFNVSLSPNRYILPALNWSPCQ
jgi:hypothetical protein